MECLRAPIASSEALRCRPCFGIARRILRDPGLAEDVLQNALATIWPRGD